MNCPVTGKSECHCKKRLASTTEGSLLLTNLRAALRVLWTEHAVYTANVIQENLPVLTSSAVEFTERLLKNPKDLANLLTKVVGAGLAQEIERGLTEHLKLAANAVKILRDDPSQVQSAIDQFYQNGNLVAAALHQINPIRIPLAEAQEMMSTHNHFVVNLASLRIVEQNKAYIDVYDRYYAHILKLSDAIYHGLDTPY